MEKILLDELSNIISAYKEGKALQFYTSYGEFKDVSAEEFDIEKWYKKPKKFRIKSESKYRPFKDEEECWQEMLKHQPFGVVKDKYFANYQTHRAFTCLVTNGCHFRGYEDETFENSFKNLLFADGTPFGVKVEK
jgi:hypothetical protein